MDIIYNILPKDLALIVESYAKDRTNYDNVVKDIDISNLLCDYDIKNYPSVHRNWTHTRICLSWERCSKMMSKNCFEHILSFITSEYK